MLRMYSETKAIQKAITFLKTIYIQPHIPHDHITIAARKLQEWKISCSFHESSKQPEEENPSLGSDNP